MVTMTIIDAADCSSIIMAEFRELRVANSPQQILLATLYMKTHIFGQYVLKFETRSNGNYREIFVWQRHLVQRLVRTTIELLNK